MDQLKKILAGFNFLQRVSIAVGALFAAVVIVGLTHYRTESDFRPLYTSMAPEDAAPVVQKLRETGVDFRLADNGSSVLVHSDKLAESRLTLAGAGLPKSGRIGFELFDKTSFGATELVEHINYQRALEGELERSVMSMAEVVEARVHLSLPKESVFIDQQQAAKASVMIKLHSGAQISGQNVLAVANLVASAVDGLSPDAVAVIDMDGNLLNRPRRGNNDDSAVTSEALDVRRQIEHDLVSKINSTLDPLLGPNKFRAGASVDCDLTSGDQQEETFDPDKSVMVSSQKSEDDNQRAGGSGGIPGTQANLPHPTQATPGGGGSGASHRVESITYQSSRIIRHTRIPQGLSAACRSLFSSGKRCGGKAKARTNTAYSWRNPPKLCKRSRISSVELQDSAPIAAISSSWRRCLLSPTSKWMRPGRHSRPQAARRRNRSGCRF